MSWVLVLALARADDFEDELYGRPASTPAPTAAPTPAPSPAKVADDALVEALVALPDHATRRARLTTELGATADGDRAGRLGQALAVVGHLERTKRTDPSIVRLFLRAALADDAATRAAAVQAASVGGDPPAATGAPAAPAATPAAVPASGSPVLAAPIAPSSPPVAALREYKRRHLVRDALEITSGGAVPVTYGGYTAWQSWSQTEHTWGVRDGGGAQLTTTSFARLVSDSSTLAKMKDEREKAKGWAIALGVGGGAATVAGLALFASDPNFDDAGGVAGIGLLTGGLTSAALCWMPPVMTRGRQKYVKSYYSIARADALVESYNAKLRGDLKLTEEDVKDIDLQPGG
jgi:hypothetical protein